MKVTLLAESILVGLFILFQIYTTMATNKTETQEYKVNKIEKDFEIRYYPEAPESKSSMVTRPSLL
jgi:hypothetical protein